MGLIFDLPKQVSWHPEEGTWPGVCQAVLDMQDTVKINFTINIPGSQTTEYRAGNKYEGVFEEGTLLYRDLWTWLKGDFSIVRNEQGKLDLSRLVGTPADLVLTHIHNSSHATPYVHIATIRAARHASSQCRRRCAEEGCVDESINHCPRLETVVGLLLCNLETFTAPFSLVSARPLCPHLATSIRAPEQGV